MNFVHLEFDCAIATITLDHPGGNRINFQMREEILHTVERVAA
jgi:enoyl-CoA hydratase/carnithine racemase